MPEGVLQIHAYTLYVRFNEIFTLYNHYRISFSLKGKYEKQELSFRNDSNTL